MLLCRLHYIVKDVVREVRQRGSVVLLVCLWLLLGGKAWYDIFWVGNTPVVNERCEVDWSVIRVMWIWLVSLFIVGMYFIFIFLSAIINVLFNIQLRRVFLMSVLFGILAGFIVIYYGVYKFLVFVPLFAVINILFIYNKEKNRLQLYKKYFNLYNTNIKQKCYEKATKKQNSNDR